jgi:hypothetical protein
LYKPLSKSATGRTERSRLAESARDGVAKIVLDRYERARKHKAGGCSIMGASVDEWIQRMDRAYNKIHEPGELEQFPNMRAYFGLTQMKVNATHSWGRNQLLGQSQSPFVLEPTDIPDLPKHLELRGQAAFRSEVMAKMLAAGADPQTLLDPRTGALREPFLPILEKLARDSKGKVRQMAYDLAQEACNNHSRVLKDQLKEGGWQEAFDAMMFDEVLYPFGCMAVAEWQERPTHTWSGNKYVVKPKLGMRFRHVPVDLAFHAPDATSAKDGSFFIEKIERDRANLMQLKLDDRSMPGAIDEILTKRHTTNRDWLGQWTNATSRPMDSEWADGETITCIRHQGEVLASDLKRAGVSALSADDAELLTLTVEVCDDMVVWFDVEPWHPNHRNYVSSSYQKNMRSAAGMSIGMMLWDRQKRLNRLDYYQQASERMAHGPVIEEMADAMANPAEFQFTPWSSFRANPDRLATMSQALRFHQAAPQWASLYTQFSQHLALGDQECGIPAFAAYGSNVGSQIPTLGQETIRFEAAAKGIQSWLQNNDDDAIEPTISLMYSENLEHLNDKSIESDAIVKPLGAVGALEKAKAHMQIVGALPNILKVAQVPGEDGRAMVPPKLVAAAVRTFFQELGLPVDRDWPDQSGALAPETLPNRAPGMQVGQAAKQPVLSGV